MHLADTFIQSDLQCIQVIHFFVSMCNSTNGAFPLHGTVRYGSLLGGFPLGTVSGTWYFFSTTSAEVPSDPYRYQNVTCKLY